MPRFTLKDVFLAMTLVAAGVCNLAAFGKTTWHGAGGAGAMLVASLGLIGAGIGSLFHCKVTGVIVVCAVAILVYWIVPTVQGSR